MFNTLPTDSVGIVNWLLDSVANAVVDESVDYVKAQIDSPFDMLLEPPLNTVATETKSYLGQATSAITTELRDL